MHFALSCNLKNQHKNRKENHFLTATSVQDAVSEHRREISLLVHTVHRTKREKKRKKERKRETQSQVQI